MLGSRAALVIACVVSLAASGCAAQQRRVAGQTLGGVSALTTMTGLTLAAGCFPFSEGKDGWEASRTGGTTTDCESGDLEPNPDVGLPMMTIGLSIAVLAGIVYATGVESPRKSAP
jgi:hypothetical protein